MEQKKQFQQYKFKMKGGTLYCNGKALPAWVTEQQLRMALDLGCDVAELCCSMYSTSPFSRREYLVAVTYTFTLQKFPDDYAAEYLDSEEYLQLICDTLTAPKRKVHYIVRGYTEEDILAFTECLIELDLELLYDNAPDYDVDYTIEILGQITL